MKLAMLLAVTGCIVFKTAVFAQSSSNRRADPGAKQQRSSGTGPDSIDASTLPGGDETGAAQEEPKEERKSPWIAIFEKSSFAEKISAARQSANRARWSADKTRESTAKAVAVASINRGLAGEAQSQAVKTIHNQGKKTGERSPAEAKKSQDLINQTVARATFAEHEARKAEDMANRAEVAEAVLEAEARSWEAYLALLEAQAMEESGEVPENQIKRYQERAVLFKVVAVKAESDLEDLCQSSFGLKSPSVKDALDGFNDL